MTRPLDPALRIRPARADDLAACAEIWRAGLDDYSGRLGRMPLSPPTRSFLDLLGHLRATDPERFLVAEREGGPAVAFVSAVRREHVWFLSMLFVLPEEQAHGLGRALLARVLPAADEGATLATCTDSAQPISNALYSRLGIVPRVPVLELVGRPERANLPALPADIRPLEMRGVGAGGAAGGTAAHGAAELSAGGAADRAALAAVDRTLLGYAHPEDHAFLARGDRRGFLYEPADGSVAGYGYVARSGRVGPVAVLDESLIAPVLGHLFGAVEPLGAFAVWVPGANAPAVQALLDAGLFLEDYPALICWSHPFADFSRYIPNTLAIL